MADIPIPFKAAVSQFELAPLKPYVDPNGADFNFGVEYFQKPLRETRQQTLALLGSDAEALTLAKKIKTNPTPESIAEFVALVECKIPSLRHDLPNWSGNEMFQHRSPNSLETWKWIKENKKANPENRLSSPEDAKVLNDEFVQRNCYGEAHHAANIVMALKDKAYLPAQTDYLFSNMKTNRDGITHVALAVYLKGKGDENQPSFILDPWQVSAGKAAPTFQTREQWMQAVDLTSSVDLDVMSEQTRQLNSKMDIVRPLDKDFLLTWYEIYAPEAWRPMQSNPEATQDMVVARYFMGDKPIFPPEAMHETYFQSLRDRMTHLAEQKNTLTSAGILAVELRKAKNFAELKPMLEKIHKTLGIDRKIFDVVHSPQEAADIIGKSDLNGNHKLDISEQRALAEIFKTNPSILSALDSIRKQSFDPTDVKEIVGILQSASISKPPPKRP